MLPGVWTHLAATSVTQGNPMKQADTQSPIVIAGGSGFLGMSLARFLTSAGRPVVILSRSAPPPGPWTHRAWDGRTLGDWAAALNGASGIVNLAGRTVDCVKTPLHCDQILRSRVESTLALGEACRRAAVPPPVWVQMSTAHIYGDSELPCDESSPFGYGLAPRSGARGRMHSTTHAPAKFVGSSCAPVSCSLATTARSPPSPGSPASASAAPSPPAPRA